MATPPHPLPPLASPCRQLCGPQAELEYLAQAGVREDLLLLRALEPGAAELPALGGAHVLPLWPGPEAK